MSEVKYVCEGTCGAELTEEEYNNGNHVCKSDGCTHLGQPFKRKVKCIKCGAFYNEGEQHIC